MAKYDRLAQLLQGQACTAVQLALPDIAAVVPGGLPPSAYRHRAWWSNESSGRHVQAQAWLSAGWQVADVDLAGGLVTFFRRRWVEP